MSDWKEATSVDRELLALVLMLIREFYVTYGDWPTPEQLAACLERPGQ